MDRKVKEALEVVYALPAKQHEAVRCVLNSPEETQAIVRSLMKGNVATVTTIRKAVVPKKVATNTKKEKANGKKANGKKAKGKKANGKKANGKKKKGSLPPLTPDILKCKGVDLIFKTAKARADSTGRTSRQAVQIPLRLAGKKEAQSDTFNKLVSKMEAAGKIKVDGHSWLVS